MIKERYPGLDIAKFIMAILVVALHVQPFTGKLAFFINQYISRVADPLFFAITSFLMFKKTYESNFSWLSLKKYIYRILKLYAGWLLIYSPVIIFITWNETGDVVHCILLLLRKVFLQGPYGALWFLTALLLAIPLTFVVTKYTNPYITLLVSFPWFMISVLQVGYTSFVTDVLWFQNIVKFIELIFGWLGNGLTYGFFFCAIGMFVAFKVKNRNRVPDSMKYKVVCLVIFSVLLFIEAILLYKNNWGYDYGSLFFLIPVSYFSLLLLLEVKMKEYPFLTFLRKCSILIFTIHYGVMEFVKYVTKDDFDATRMFVLVLFVTLLFSIFIIWLSNNSRFKWLKNFY